MDYTGICFVIMPFGRKKVGSREVDFDAIYDGIFEPAIRATPLPDAEGESLEPRRTDRDFFTGEISVEMFHYLEYSRFALADISGLNPNVFYELGHRHRARASGTAVFRQAEAPIPFDINKIKVFPYEFGSEEAVGESRQLITRVLGESLQQNRLDSPVQSALSAQQETARRHPEVDEVLREAENALRNRDLATAAARYRDAVAADAENPLLRVKLGDLLKSLGDWEEALEHFTRATEIDGRYSDAHREKGIAEGKLDPERSKLDGEASLRTAIQLNPKDFDALSSLGGILKRRGDLEGALDLYRQASEVSRGHTYPLLNALKLQAHLDGRLELDRKTLFQLKRAERSLGKQIDTEEPYNAPWSFFDLAEVRLYRGDPQGFLDLVERGIDTCEAGWQPRTFLASLQLLPAGEGRPEELDEALALLAEAADFLP